MTHKSTLSERFGCFAAHFLAVSLIFGIACFLPSPAFAQNTDNAKTLGDMTNTMYDSFVSLQTFLSVLSYVLGTFFSISGLRMLRDHVDDPSRNPAHMSALRLGAAGFFLFAPSAANMLIGTLTGDTLGNSGVVMANDMVTVDATTFGGTGLDKAVGRFVIDIASPMLDNAIPLFAYMAGTVFMLIGLKRLALANGDGPQAPGGLGTAGSLLTAGGLMAFGYVMYILQGSIFGSTDIFTQGTLNSASPMAEQANQTLWAVFIFLRIVGYISVLRGLFMLRAVAEGGNVSMMGVMTHLIAGALLANGGMLVQMIQCTFIGDSSQFAFSTLPGAAECS
jgi:hypothetical protein